MIIFNKNERRNCLRFDKNRSVKDGGFHIYLKDIIKNPAGYTEFLFEISFSIDTDKFISARANKIIATWIPKGLGKKEPLLIDRVMRDLRHGVSKNTPSSAKKTGRYKTVKATTLDEINVMEQASWVTDIPVIADLIWKGCEGGTEIIEAMMYTPPDQVGNGDRGGTVDPAPTQQPPSQQPQQPGTDGGANEVPNQSSSANLVMVAVGRNWPTLVKQGAVDNPEISQTIKVLQQDVRKAVAIGIADKGSVIIESKQAYAVFQAGDVSVKQGQAADAVVVSQFDTGMLTKEFDLGATLVASEQDTRVGVLDTEIVQLSNLRYRSAVDVMEGNIGQKMSEAQDSQYTDLSWSNEEPAEEDIANTVEQDSTEAPIVIEMLEKKNELTPLEEDLKGAGGYQKQPVKK